MPNWCYNKLKVSGNQEQLEQFLAKEFRPENYIPETPTQEKVDVFLAFLEDNQKSCQTPKKENLTNEKIEELANLHWFNNGGYEWRISNWGTKWSWDILCINNSGPKSRCLIFDTAWSPPCPVVKKASEMFPKLLFTLEYFEGGMGFCGVFKCKNGEILKDETKEYRGRLGG